MRFFKKLSFVSLSLAISLVLLVSCAQKSAETIVTDLGETEPRRENSMVKGVNEDPKNQKKLKLVGINFPAYDFLRAVAGNRAEVTMLLKPGAESHTFEPSAQDILTLEHSDFLVYTGGDADYWMKNLLEGSLESKPKLAMMDAVPVLYEEEVKEGMEHYHAEDEDHEHIDGESLVIDEAVAERFQEKDEHVWTDPRNAMMIVDAIVEELSEIEPSSAVYFKLNADEYKEKLEKLDASFEAITQDAPIRTLLFADRFPLRYFAERYKLDYLAAFTGCSAQTDPSAGTLAFLDSKIKSLNLPVVFHIELSSTSAAEALSQSTGAKVQEFNACHNVSQEQFDKGLTYVDLMRTNLEPLKEALYGVK